MRHVSVVITGRTPSITTLRGWVQSRVEAAAREAARRGAAAGATANGVAVVAVSLWANETGWGESERRYNVGSVHCVESAAGDCMRLRDGEMLRAYPDLESAVREWFGLVQASYPRAYDLLMAGELSYWDNLQRNGYGGHESADNALLIYRRVCRESGIAAMDDAQEQAFRRSWVGGASSVSPLAVAFLAAALSKAAGWW